MRQEHLVHVLQDPLRAGICRKPEQMTDILTAAETAGMLVRCIDLGNAGGKGDLLALLAAALNFPDWFGNNWDALADCLGDLSWLPAKGYVLLLTGADAFAARHAEAFSTAVAILAEASENWRSKGVPFWVLIETRSETLHPFPFMP